MNYKIILVIFGVGCFILGAVLGTMIYGSTWYFNSTRVALYESLNVNSTLAGLVNGIIASIGAVLIIVAVMFIKKEKR